MRVSSPRPPRKPYHRSRGGSGAFRGSSGRRIAHGSPTARYGSVRAVISSIVTTAALLVGARLAARYLENFSGVSLAGATSALLGLLDRLYLEAQILLAGAELNRAIELRDAPERVWASFSRAAVAARASCRSNRCPQLSIRHRNRRMPAPSADHLRGSPSAISAAATTG